MVGLVEARRRFLHRDVLPDALGLVGPGRAAAELGDEETGGGERLIAQVLRGAAMPRPARE
ncbi:MAG: hypothetical protein ACKOTF_09785, partial [Opitutaceae bacterium]